MVEVTMDVQSWLRKQLENASPDLLHVMVREVAEALMPPAWAVAEKMLKAGRFSQPFTRLS